MSRSKSARPKDTDAPILSLDEATWNEVLARDEFYPQKFRDATADIEFFDLLQELPESVWDSRFLVYIYLLDPVIRNKQGEKSYLVKLAQPIDEEWLRKKYNGGKFHLYLKDGRDTLKELKFRIEGEFVDPDRDQRQVPAPGASAATPPTQTPSPGAEIATAIEATTRASQQGFDIVTHGAKATIDILKEQIVQKNQTSNPVDDLVKVATAIKALAPAPVPENPLVAKLLEAAITAFTARTQAPPAEPPEPPDRTLENNRS